MNPEEYVEQTNWLNASDAKAYTLIAMGARLSDKGKWGPKAYMDAMLDGDSEATLYTISFNQKSPAYAQLQRILEEEGATAFPFRCRVTGIGQTFALGSAAETTASTTAKVAPAADARKSPPRPSLPKQPVEDESPF